MNNRQTKILHQLVRNNTNETLTIDMIASSLNCSERTVRNDFKQIDLWLKKESFQAEIIRRPNIGVRFEGSDKEKRQILSLIDQSRPMQADRSDEERKLHIMTMLINEGKTVSLQDLMNEFFVSKQVIKQDLLEISSWLEPFGLAVESKQKVGIRLIGKERDKRTALLRFHTFFEEDNLPSFYNKWFSEAELSKVKHQIKRLEKELNKQFTSDSFLNLVFHLLITTQRIKRKQTISLSLENAEALKAKKEYEVTRNHLKELESFFLIKFPEDEILYFLLHVLSLKEKNTGTHSFNEAAEDIHGLIRTMIQKTSQLTNITHDTDPLLFDSLAAHMQTTFERIKHGLYHKNPLLLEIKQAYPYTFATLFQIMEELNETVGFVFPEDEIGYLVLHFEASKERLKKLNGKNKRAIVVCSMGIGMSQLLTTKIERKFHSLELLRCVAADEVEESIRHDQPDFIISTIPLEHTTLPVILVSPLFPKAEEEKLKEFISTADREKFSDFSALKKFLDQELIILGEELEGPDKIIESLCGLLEKNGYVNKDYVHDSIEREALSATAIGGEIAIPHGNPRNVLKQGVAVAIFKNPVHWKQQLVSVVFMLAIKDTKDEAVKKMFEEISYLGENQNLIEEWKKMKTADQFYTSI
ncbi:BglG family transcription antiterminator [Jeotgalibacillus proteolyticus]|uniref:Uncharacterized protein n=1 Tax=Jeotgalibacillus proteolyticus TaxID=2082395 RepID=A0A2S5G998_9BACL|nr:BglG family transcription antiterminator [Jeotgalibacillus proteolyticus]PPA69549.1 hypothetical protein C4B60_13455 [Jeotgalibacillus proteolyticus]